MKAHEALAEMYLSGRVLMGKPVTENHRERAYELFRRVCAQAASDSASDTAPKLAVCGCGAGRFQCLDDMSVRCSGCGQYAPVAPGVKPSDYPKPPAPDAGAEREMRCAHELPDGSLCSNVSPCWVHDEPAVLDVGASREANYHEPFSCWVEDETYTGRIVFCKACNKLPIVHRDAKHPDGPEETYEQGFSDGKRAAGVHGGETPNFVGGVPDVSDAVCPECGFLHPAHSAGADA